MVLATSNVMPFLLAAARRFSATRAEVGPLFSPGSFIPKPVPLFPWNKSGYEVNVEF